MKKYLEKKPYGKGKSWALDSTTVNISLIKGGTRVNVTPRQCEVTIDIRVPIGVSTGDLHLKVDETLKQTGLKLDEISYKWILPKCIAGGPILLNFLILTTVLTISVP